MIRTVRVIACVAQGIEQSFPNGKQVGGGQKPIESGRGQAGSSLSRTSEEPNYRGSGAPSGSYCRLAVASTTIVHRLYRTQVQPGGDGRASVSLRTSARATSETRRSVAPPLRKSAHLCRAEGCIPDRPAGRPSSSAILAEWCRPAISKRDAAGVAHHSAHHFPRSLGGKGATGSGQPASVGERQRKKSPRWAAGRLPTNARCLGHVSIRLWWANGGQNPISILPARA